MKRIACMLIIVFAAFLSACSPSSNLTEIDVYEAENRAESDVPENHHFAEGFLHETTSNYETHAAINLMTVVNCDLLEYSVSSEPIVPEPIAPVATASLDYLTFDDALVQFATDVVIVRYIGSRPFGQNLTEFEFVVIERILGDAAERIFVYSDSNVSTHVSGIPRPVAYRPGDLTFRHETNYMLPLIAINHPHANTHEDGFRFINNIVIDLDNPLNSIMYSEPLSLHSERLDFNERISRNEIVSHVAELTQYNLPGRSIIRSQVIDDIVIESPFVLTVEINEPIRLSNEQLTTDWMATDIYYVTIVKVLKGDISVGREIAVIFSANSVFSGEVHTVAIEPIADGSNWFRFTSRNSLFNVNQLDKIMSIIENNLSS